MKNLDQVVLVNGHDHEIGVMDKVEAHRGEGLLHRASSVFLFNKNRELLIQQRSTKKIVGALQWANTCCGNVRPDEDYLKCAIRRLKEELGIEGVKLTKVHKFIYQARCNEEFSEHEMDTVFIGRYDGVVRPNPDEIADYKWIKWEEFLERIERAKENREFILAPWVQMMRQKGVLEKVEEVIKQ